MILCFVAKSLSFHVSFIYNFISWLTPSCAVPKQMLIVTTVRMLRVQWTFSVVTSDIYVIIGRFKLTEVFTGNCVRTPKFLVFLSSFDHSVCKITKQNPAKTFFITQIQKLLYTLSPLFNRVHLVIKRYHAKFWIKIILFSLLMENWVILDRKF